MSFQFTSDRLKYTELQRKGIVTNAQSYYRKARDTDYADIRFTTKSGQVIKKSVKCGSRKTFDEQYAYMSVIYNPDNPEGFQNIYDYNKYSLLFRVVFFFVFYLAFLTFFLYITHIGELLIKLARFTYGRLSFTHPYS